MTPIRASSPVDPDAIAAATRAVVGVVDLSAGPLGQYRMYLGGRSVPGVRVDDERVRLDLVLTPERPFATVVRDVVGAVRGLLGGRALTVNVSDVQSEPARPTVISDERRGRFPAPAPRRAP